MFGTKKTIESTSTANPNASTLGTSNNNVNTLAKGTFIEGNITSDNDIRFDGKMKGNFICKAKVVIGPEGEVEGDIQCFNAVVEGKFKGTLHVSELLTIKDTASVWGDVYANDLVVQSGANFNGKFKMSAEVGANSYQGKSTYQELKNSIAPANA